MRLHTKKRPTRRDQDAQAPSTREIRAQLKRLEKWINDLDMIPATQVYRSKVVLPMFSKALTVGRAICVLVDEDFPAEAFGLSRTLVDLYFCIRYISNKDTDSRMTTYVEYWARVHQEWGNIVAKHFSTSKVSLPLWHEEVMKMLEKAIATTRSPKSSQASTVGQVTVGKRSSWLSKRIQERRMNTASLSRVSSTTT